MGPSPCAHVSAPLTSHCWRSRRPKGILVFQFCQVLIFLWFGRASDFYLQLLFLLFIIIIIILLVFVFDLPLQALGFAGDGWSGLESMEGVYIYLVCIVKVW